MTLAVSSGAAAAERLAEWADEARRAGRTNRADQLLMLAWEAYDRPAKQRFAAAAYDALPRAPSNPALTRPAPASALAFDWRKPPGSATTRHGGGQGNCLL